jgi:hypothetical protein
VGAIKSLIRSQSTGRLRELFQEALGEDDAAGVRRLAASRICPV